MPAIIPRLLGLWLSLLSFLMLFPLTSHLESIGEQRIRASIDFALVLWGTAVFYLLHLEYKDWSRQSPQFQLVRWLWTLSLITYLVHMAWAFHYYHGWSHQDAFERTDRITGFGYGIYVSYLFTAVWLIEVMFWWIVPNLLARRSPWVDRLIHGFMGFILFNGSVIYASGPVRWFSFGMFLFLGIQLVMRWLYLQKQSCRQPEITPESILNP